MINAKHLTESTSRLLRPGESPLFASRTNATASPWLPGAGVLALTDARLLRLQGGRRRLSLQVTIGALNEAIDRSDVQSVVDDYASRAWTRLTFVLTDGRNLGVTVPARDVGQWLEAFPAPPDASTSG